MLTIIQAAGWPIWPLIACSILALALVIERFVALRTPRIAPPQLLDEVLTVCAKGLPSNETVGQLAQNSLLGEVLATGLRTLQSHPSSSEAELRSAMEGAGRTAAHRLEKYLTALATIASAAPLLGLLVVVKLEPGTMLPSFVATSRVTGVPVFSTVKLSSVAVGLGTTLTVTVASSHFCAPLESSTQVL